MHLDQMKFASQAVRKLITSLLIVDPNSRLTADQCLHHKWLSSPRKLAHRQTLVELETSFMKKCLARRRWHRAMNAFQVGFMNNVFAF